MKNIYWTVTGQKAGDLTPLQKIITKVTLPRTMTTGVLCLFGAAAALATQVPCVADWIQQGAHHLPPLLEKAALVVKNIGFSHVTDSVTLIGGALYGNTAARHEEKQIITNAAADAKAEAYLAVFKKAEHPETWVVRRSPSLARKSLPCGPAAFSKSILRQNRSNMTLGVPLMLFSCAVEAAMMHANSASPFLSWLPSLIVGMTMPLMASAVSMMRSAHNVRRGVWRYASTLSR